MLGLDLVPKLSQVSRLLGSKPRTYMAPLAAGSFSGLPSRYALVSFSFIQVLVSLNKGDLHFFLGIEAKRTSTALVE